MRGKFGDDATHLAGQEWLLDDRTSAFGDKFGELALAVEFLIQSLEAVRDLGAS